jgi:hypothetical protein
MDPPTACSVTDGPLQVNRISEELMSQVTVTQLAEV